MTDEIKISGGSVFDGVYQVPEIEKAVFNVSAELQKAIATATELIEDRTFAARHPELGKMVNCPVCGTRHRMNERKCVQVFTYTAKDKDGLLYQRLKENENGDIVRDYRTCAVEGTRPTRNQLSGSPRAHNFGKPRFNPHLSKIKLQFIQRTREVFVQLGYSLEDDPKGEVFQKNLQRARVLAARDIRRERELSDREFRRRQDQSRRINKGLL